MDEATFTLDTETETAVMESIEALQGHKTLIIIAHRLSTIKDCDLIVCFNEGEIVEKGTHKELLEKNGYYKNLYDAQM